MKDLACALRVSRVVGHACILFHNGRGLTHSILLTLLFALNRFMPLFVGVLPTHVTLTIWDAFFLEEREVRACRCGRGVWEVLLLLLWWAAGHVRNAPGCSAACTLRFRCSSGLGSPSIAITIRRS